MKKELSYIKERYKKQQNNKIVSNNGHDNYENIEVNKIKKLIDYNYSSQYCYWLFDEFGSFIKVKNYIEDNIGYDKFKQIYTHCIDNYIPYHVFVSYIKNPDTFDYTKIKIKKNCG